MRVTVVVATMNRRDSLLRTLARLAALPEEPPVVVVDNGSRDGTVEAVRAAFPRVTVVPLRRNLGGAARTVGVQRASTPYVAFADDDSWWEPGALALAARRLDADPAVALVAARVLVGPDGREDPTSTAMRASPLGEDVLGFVACGSVVRRTAYLDAGGFHAGFGVGGEEAMLALDLAHAGHRLVYADEVVARHHPSPVRNRSRRRAGMARNEVLVAWLRLTFREAARRTTGLLRSSFAEPHARRALVSLVPQIPVVLRERRPVGPALERDYLRVERACRG